MKNAPGHDILLGLTIASLVAAVVTLLPHKGHFPKVLGYGSLCTWAPWSTLFLLGFSVAFWFGGRRLLASCAKRSETNPDRVE